MKLYWKRILFSPGLLAVPLIICGIYLAAGYVIPPPPPLPPASISITSFPAAGEEDTAEYYVEGTITNFDSGTMYVFVFAINSLGEAFVKPFANDPLTETEEIPGLGEGGLPTVTYSTRVHTDPEDTLVESYAVLVVPKEDAGDLSALSYAELSVKALDKRTVKR